MLHLESVSTSEQKGKGAGSKRGIDMSKQEVAVGGLQLYGPLSHRTSYTTSFSPTFIQKKSYKNTSALHSRMEFVNLLEKCSCVTSGSPGCF